MNPNERHVTSRWLHDLLKEEREHNSNVPSMFKELEHVPCGGASDNHPPPPTRPDRLFSQFESSAPEADMVLQLKIVGLPRHVLWHLDRDLSYTGCCKFFQNLGFWVLLFVQREPIQSAFSLDWSKWIHSVFHHKYNALGESTAVNQTDKVSRGPRTQDSAWHTVGAKYIFTEWMHE